MMERDSVVVTATVRAVSPFVVTYGLFLALHGTKSVGGGFQGGVVVAAAVVTLGFAFGARQTRRALDTRRLLGAAALGVAAFGAVALGSVALGGAFLDPTLFPVRPAYVVETVEVAIAVTVASVLSTLFLVLAGGSDA